MAITAGPIQVVHLLKAGGLSLVFPMFVTRAYLLSSPIALSQLPVALRPTITATVATETNRESFVETRRHLIALLMEKIGLNSVSFDTLGISAHNIFSKVII